MQPFSPIKGISQQIAPVNVGADKKKTEGDKYSFNNIIMGHIKTTSDVLHQSIDDKDKMVRGELKNPHQAAISGMKAGVMLRLTTNIMSKISSACTTLFQMQI